MVFQPVLQIPLEDRPVVVASGRELAASPRAEHDYGHVVGGDGRELGGRQLYLLIGQLLSAAQVDEVHAMLGRESV